MILKENRLLRTGILGCGPIAQFAHFESCQKARNAGLYAICDAAPDLLDRMNTRWQPARAFSDYDQMLADPELECVIIATSDAFHLTAARKAVEAGKHVLVEKPAGTSLTDCYALHELAVRKGVRVQVGHMKRFDPGIRHAHRFLRERAGELMFYSGWYMDSTHRYTVTDNVQPLPVLSSRALKPGFDEKADKTRYYLLAHGSHLLDTAHYLAGEIGSLETRLVHRFGAWCWSMHVDFKSGAVGHLNLTVPHRGDWNEGFSASAEHGSVEGKTYNPWYFRGSDVKCFFDKTATFEQVLGADAHFYRLQLEGLADTVLHGTAQTGTNLAEGILNIKAMLAVQQSIRERKRVYLDTIQEGEL